MNRKEYLKERQIIFQTLNLLSNKIGAVYIIIALALSVIHLACVLIQPYSNAEGMFYSPFIVFFFVMTGIPFALSGTSSLGGKPVIAENFGIKGAQNQLGAFLCMPIKKESIYRAQFEVITACSTSISMMFAGNALGNMFGNNGFFIPNLITLFLTYSCFTLLFILVYSPIFITYKTRTAVNALYIIFIILLMIHFFAVIFFEIFFAVNNTYPYFSESGGFAGNTVIIVISVLYPFALFIVYKNIILKKKGAGWYE